MCSLFGLLDYRNALTPAQRHHILRLLAISCEDRGRDATGLSYINRNKLVIRKATKEPRAFRFYLPSSASFVMGHTRMTTQGSERKNYNNHPFYGKAGGRPFALAHNGMIRNDLFLRRRYRLPDTKIETDSYAIVQMIEQKTGGLLNRLSAVAAELEGSFTFTVLSAKGLYVVKGNNPFCLCHFPDEGYYLYASTQEILRCALRKLSLKDKAHHYIPVNCGSLLHIKPDGALEWGRFYNDSLMFCDSQSIPSQYHLPLNHLTEETYCDENLYLSQVIAYALARGVSERDLRRLLRAGFNAFDIEDLIDDDDLRRQCLEEISWS